MIDEHEYKNVVQKGVAQRARAIKAFLQDHFSGNKKYLQEKIIPESVIKGIIERNLEEDWIKYIKPQDINFSYGPDTIRASDGSFRVIEDNPGFIGGPGDIEHARNSLEKRMPEYKDLIKGPHPSSYFDRVIESYKNKLRPGTEIVHLRYNNAQMADREDLRLEKIYERYGIKTVRLHHNGGGSDLEKIIVNDKGVFIETKVSDTVKRRREVGFVITNIDTSDIDRGHPAHKKKILFKEGDILLEIVKENPSLKIDFNVATLEEALGKSGKSTKINFEKLEEILKIHYQNQYSSLLYKSNINGLMNHIASGKVKTNNIPGIEFIGDKEFCLYVDDLVKFYLKEEPLIKNIPTDSFRSFDKNENKILNQKFFDTVFKNKDKYVIKKVDGRGGDAVYIGSKMSDPDFKDLQKAIKQNPEFYIAQEFTPISVMDNMLVDMRVLTDVSPNGVIVSDIPFGRAIPVDGDGKVNISVKGRETTVLVEPSSCLKSTLKNMR